MSRTDQPANAAGGAAPTGASPTAGAAASARARFTAAGALFRRELSAFFQTPVAYVVGVVFLVVTAILFFSVFFLFDRAEMRQFFGSLPLVLALLMPALAMRLIAEERRRGTWEVLATLPLDSGDVVVAKFAAVWVTGLFLLLPTVFFAITVAGFGRLDAGPVVGGYLGAALLVAAYGAAGVFASSIARNETVALVLGLVLSLFLALLESFVVLVPAPLVGFVEYLSIGYHFSGFARGIIDTRSVVYLGSLVAVFLLLARARILVTRRHRLATVNLSLALVVIVLFNLVSTNTFTRLDLTRTNAYSLSRVSRETLARLEDPLRVRVFYNAGVPAPYNSVRQYLLDLLREYDSADDRYFSFEVVDPTTPEGRAEAQQYGLQQVEIQEIRSDEFQSRAVFLGAVVLYGNVTERIDQITSTDGLEYQLTTAMRSAISQVDALAGATEPVTMRVIASPGLADLQIQGFAELRAQMGAIHELVNNDNYNRLDYEFLEPETDAEIDALVAEYGVQPFRWEARTGQTQRGILEIVLAYDDRVQRVPLEIYQALFGGYVLEEAEVIEESVRNGLRALMEANPRVAWATGAGEKLPGDYQRGAGPFGELVGQRYEVVTVDLATEPIPSGIDTLIIAGPTKRYSEAALYRIDQFVMGGGSLLVFADRYAQQIPSQQEMMAGAQPTWAPVTTGLEDLLAAWGATVTSDVVLDEESFVARQAGGQQQIFQAPVLQGQGINRELVVSRELEDVIVFTMTEILPTPRDAADAGAEAPGTEAAGGSAGAGSDAAGSGAAAGSDAAANDAAASSAAARPAYIPVLTTSPNSWIVASPEEAGPWIQGVPASADTIGRDVAVLLEGTFASTFDGPVDLDTTADPEVPGATGTPAAPGATPQAGDPTQAGAANATPAPGAASSSGSVAIDPVRFRARSAEPARVMVISGSALTTAQLLDPQQRTPNGTFLMNVVDYLNGAPGMAELRSKGLGVARLVGLTPAARVVARWSNLILVPALVVIAGVIVWTRRSARARRIHARFETTSEETA